MNNLIVYFSWSGNTDKLVKELNKQFQFDVKRIERKIPYSEDYNTCAYVEAKQEWQNRTYPEIKKVNIDYSKYDKILLFFPIWWYTFPMPIATFIKSIKGYHGEIYVFANSYTNDPQYMATSMKELKELDKNLNFKQALFNKNAKEHIDFIKNI